MYDNLDKSTDTRIRVQDIQDRIYDTLDKSTDTQIRVQDIQDRAYDVLWQQKTSNHQREMMFWEIYKLPGESLVDTKCRFFHTIPSATGTQRKSQRLLAQLLKEICEVCEKNDLPYWLDFGTLIGAIRHSGFIPWDDDIDIGMMRKDAEKLAELLHQGELAERYQFRKCFFNQNANGIIQIFQIRYAGVPFDVAMPNVDVFFYDYCDKHDCESWKYFQKVKNDMVEEAGIHTRTSMPFEFDEQIDKECAKVIYDHYIASIALCGFYWFCWGLYKGSVNDDDGFFMIPAYRNCIRFIDVALEKYEEKFGAKK